MQSALAMFSVQTPVSSLAVHIVRLQQSSPSQLAWDFVSEGRLRLSDAAYRVIQRRYLLATCTFTPLYGRLSNVLGRRGANQTAVFFACLGTIACGLSTNMESLIAARFVRIAFDYVGRFVLMFPS